MDLSSCKCNDLLYANFNQNFTSLCISTCHGYKIFSLNSIDSLKEIYSGEIENVSLIEGLFSSNLIAFVSLFSPKKLKLYHLKKKAEICYYSYGSPILSIKMNRIRMIVLLEESIHIHNLQDMLLLHSIYATPQNHHGICALSIRDENSLLAYPGSADTGEVQIFDTENMKAVTMIHAHHNPIAALSFNIDATKLATASDKGTVIRVFSVSGGEKLFEFRRGVSRYVDICCLAFSQDSSMLVASSNTETVHLFKLDQPAVDPTKNMPSYDEGDTSWSNYLNKIISTSSTYLPSQVTNMLAQDRAFATIKLPFSGYKNICALATMQKLMRVLVVSADGYLYIYNLNTTEGGECTLVRQHKLNNNSEILVASAHSQLEVGTYADATKGKTQERIYCKQHQSDYNETTSVSSSGSSVCSVDFTPHGTMLMPIETHDLAESLPLDDDKEFPPMSLE